MAWGYARYLFDYYQRDDIDAAAGDAGAALYTGQVALDNTEALRKQLLMQREQIAELGVLVSVLVKMLAESGAVDDKVLRYRTEAALDAVAEAADAKANEAAQGPQVQCVRCDSLVPARSITITTEGNTCDRCIATGQ